MQKNNLFTEQTIKNPSLPSLEMFKREAYALEEINDTLKHTEALHKIAQKYGYRNYNAIKPVLKSEVFPVTDTELMEHIIFHLQYHANRGDAYFIGLAYEILDAELDLIKAIYGKEDGQIYLRSKSDLLSLEGLFDNVVIHGLISVAGKRGISTRRIVNILKRIDAWGSNEGKTQWLQEKEVTAEIKFDETYTPDNIQELIEILEKSVQVKAKNDKAKSDNDAMIQQLAYIYNSILSILVLLPKGELTGKYYKKLQNAIGELETLAVQEIKRVEVFANTLNYIFSKAEEFRDKRKTKEEFAQYIQNVLPKRKTLEGATVMDEYELLVIFDNEEKLLPSLSRLTREKTKEAKFVFESVLTELVYREELKELDELENLA